MHAVTMVKLPVLVDKERPGELRLPKLVFGNDIELESHDGDVGI